MKTTILFLMLLIPTVAYSDIYYVDNEGDNSNSGTIIEPWETLSYAFSQIEAGDTLYLREGVFEEGGLMLSNSGNTIDGYIHISSYPSETAVIDGTDFDGSNGFLLNERAYFKLENLEIRDFLGGNGLWITNCNNFEINNCEIHNCFYGIGVAFGSHDFVLNNVNIHHFMLYGFDATPVNDDMPCYNGTFNDCMSHTGLDDEQNVDGFALGHGTQYNFIFNRCTTYSVYDGFDISSRDVTLNECSAYDCVNGGYKLWQDNITLNNCLSYNHGITCVEIDWNGNPKSVLLSNCTFFNAEVWNIWIENTADTLEMYNCIIAGGDNIGLGFGEDDLSNYFGDNNIFHCDNESRTINSGYVIEFSIDDIAAGDWADYSGQDANSLVSTEPAIQLFVDQDSGDLALRENAIAIDQATALNAPAVDFRNLPRPGGSGYDIGAYEWYPITCSADNEDVYCTGENISIDFDIYAEFNENNIFTAQLSNSDGSFSSAESIGTFTGTASGTILGQIPEDSDVGVSYRIRVVSSNPEFVGATNLDELSISSCQQDHSIETNIYQYQYCAGNNIMASYTVHTLFDSDNVFSLQLSDRQGGFESPVTIGTVSNNISGTLGGVLPINLIAGSEYRLRIVSSSPESTGTDNGSDISIEQCVFLISPDNNAQSIELTPELDWGDVNNATSYTIQLAVDEGFEEIIIEENTDQTYYNIPINRLENGAVYYWRCMAYFGDNYTDWSDIWNFTTFIIDYTKVISFQGSILDTNNEEIPNGEIEITFSLFQDSDPENALWTETQEITVVNSFIMAYLGLINPLSLDFNTHYWLGISIGNDELTRVPMTASPYSIGNVRSVNNMNGNIIISGGNGVDVNTVNGEITIELTDPNVMNNEQLELKSYDSEIIELKNQIEKLMNENINLKERIQSLEKTK